MTLNSNLRVFLSPTLSLSLSHTRTHITPSSRHLAMVLRFQFGVLFAQYPAEWRDVPRVCLSRAVQWTERGRQADRYYVCCCGCVSLTSLYLLVSASASLSLSMSVSTESIGAALCGHRSKEEFIHDLKTTCSRNDAHMVISFHRETLRQTGDGHFSPVGLYNDQRKMALILDTARFKVGHMVS